MHKNTTKCEIKDEKVCNCFVTWYYININHITWFSTGGENMNEKLPRYMNYGETMKYLNIGSYNTLYKFIKSGLKVTIIAGTKRIDQQEADKFMAEKAI